MSILFSSDHGWFISHKEITKTIYKNVLNKNELKNYQLKCDLFKINAPFLRFNENINKYSNSSLKKKRKNNSTSVNKCEDLQNIVQHVFKLYVKFIEQLRLEKVFENSKEQNNDNAKQLAAKCCQESNLNGFTGFGENGDEACLQTINEEIYLFPNNCRFYCKNVSEMTSTLSEDKFDLILLDPPWWNKSIRRKRARNEQSYDMMYNTDLTVIPIDKILDVGGLVVIWCTNSPQHLSDLTNKVFPSWGVEIVSRWYWLKMTLSGELVCKFAEPLMKQPFEQIIIAKRKCDPVSVIPDNKIIISVPSAINSHKPPLTEVLKPYIGGNRMCLEVFARYLLPNWTSWGLEAIKFQHLSLYEESY